MEKIDKNNIVDVYALTPMQEGMLFHYLQDPLGEYYFEQLILTLKGEIDLNIFKLAWESVIYTNEILRTVFSWERTGKPLQLVLKEHPFSFIYYDFTSKIDGEKHQAIQSILASDKTQKFNLHTVPFRITLCRIDVNEFEMIVSNHHILYDGWSNGIILKEFLAAYEEIKGNTNSNSLLITTKNKWKKTPFKEFIRWLQSPDRERGESYWRNYLHNYEFPMIPWVKTDVVEENKSTGFSVIEINNEVKRYLEKYIQSNKTTFASLFYCSWGLVLQKYFNCSDIIFGTTVSGRSVNISGIEDIVGLFINTLPLRVTTLQNIKIKEVLSKIDNDLREREQFLHTSLVEIKEFSRIENNQELFNSLVVIENYPLETLIQKESSSQELTLSSYSMDERTHYDLTLSIILFDGIRIQLSYNSQLFSQNISDGILSHFTEILEQIVRIPEFPVSSVQIVSTDERRKILFEFNNTKRDFSPRKTIAQLFVEQVERNFNYTAVSSVNLPHSNGEFFSFTYGELNHLSQRIAKSLKMRGAQRETLVAIMMARSVELLSGILGILNAGAAYLPIEPSFPSERINFILKDSGSRVLLYNGNSVELPGEEKGILSGFGLSMLDFQIVLAEHGTFKDHINNCNCSNGYVYLPSDLAYTIYTSGTTGRPKGVMVQQSSVVNTLLGLDIKYPFKKGDAYLFKTPVIFDVSVTELFGWFIGNKGGRLVILPKDEEKNPQSIIFAIALAHITHINFVPSMFRIFLEELNVNNKNKLSGLKYFFLAGEELLPVLVDRFKALIPNIRLENLYGPTEAAIYASWFSLSQWTGYGNIPIGLPLFNVELYILDKDAQIQAIGVPGELFISGVGVARGYLNNPGLTAERFCFRGIGTQLKKCSPSSKNAGNLHSPSQQLTHSTNYHTGDLARWLPDGNIEFLGRIDRQVKIRGIRIELAEIENHLLGYEEIQEAVVIVNTNVLTGDELLCAYIVHKNPNIPTDWENLRTQMAKSLPGFMIPSFFIPISGLPLTPSGKVDRNALPEPELKTSNRFQAPRNDIERRVESIWASLLGFDKTVQKPVGIDDHFFHVGGHSLKVVGLMGRIRQAFAIEFPLTELYKRLTIRQISQFISAKKGVSQKFYRPLFPVEEKEFYPLSPAQKHLYIIQQQDIDSTLYNMFEVIRLDGDVEKEKIQDIFRQLIYRHECLRSSIVVFKGVPVQRIHKSVEFFIADTSPDEFLFEDSQNIIRPFDLSQAPLLRISLLKSGIADYTLIIDLHHIVSDGVSIEILIKEFKCLYEGTALPPLKFRFTDYIEFQQQNKCLPRLMEQKQYWLREFRGLDSDGVLQLNFPSDFSKPSLPSYEGEHKTFILDAKKVTALKRLSESADSTLFSVLLSIYFIFLAKICGQEAIVVGTPLAGRSIPELEHLIGFFVNTLGIKGLPGFNTTFTQFLNELKDTLAAALENQDYPFAELLEDLDNTGISPLRSLFDTVFSLESVDVGKIDIPGLTFQRCQVETGTAKFDLMLVAKEVNQELHFTFEYKTSLFKSSTIDLFIQYIKEVIATVSEHPGIAISEIDIAPVAMKKRILLDFNNTSSDFPREKIHELFIQQAELSPHHIAIVDLGVVDGVRVGGNSGPHFVTYSELNRTSSDLAFGFREEGIRDESIVALMVKGSIDSLIYMIAILKSGAAYMPIDPDNPQERINYLLKDSLTNFIISSTGLTKRELHSRPVFSASQNTPGYNSGNSQLSYVMFTSGTTGRPKGVMVSHTNVVRLVKGTNFIDFLCNDRILQTGAFEFDATTFEIWGALLNGLTLYIVEKQAILNRRALSRIIKSHFISVMWMTSPLFNQVVQDGVETFAGLRVLLVGGDVLSPSHIDRVRQFYPELQLINGYGPTENTTFSTTYLINTSFDSRIPIGCPIANSTAYIIGLQGQLQPVGIVGELWVGGDGVARGYMNNPELTASKFKQVSWAFHHFNNETLLRGVQGGGFLEKSPHGCGRHSLYRTGDLARWCFDGTIEFLGRKDNQVKIRGNRIELEEIETHLLRHSQIKEAILIVKEENSTDKYLCAYVVPDGAVLTSAELREFLSGKIPVYMIPSFFMFLPQIPLTPNGKVDRRALPEPEAFSASDSYVPPRDEIEEKLIEMWSDILGVHRQRIGIDSDFFELGGHSLKANLLVNQIHSVFSVDLPLSEVFTSPFIRGMAHFIRSNVPGRFQFIFPVEDREYYPLSSAQKRIYIVHQMLENSVGTAYNMTEVFDLHGEVDKQELERAFGALVRRHDSLRTSFVLVNDVPVQRVHREINFKIEGSDLNNSVESPSKNNDGIEPAIKSFIRPFQLSQAPLFRVGVIGLNEKNYILVVDLHHIIADGASVEGLIWDFKNVYRGRNLPNLKLQYKDVVFWQQKNILKTDLQKQKEFWLNQFTGEIPVLALPTDYTRPVVQDFSGGSISYTVPEAVFGSLKKLANEEGLTLFMVLLSAYCILLARISGQEDIVTGIPASGRRHSDLNGIMGMFVNTLALRNFPRGEKPLLLFFNEVKSNFLNAYENQDFQYEDIIDAIGINRDTGRNPLFDVAFSLQTEKSKTIRLPDVELTIREMDAGVSKFDLTLYAIESENELIFRWEYSRAFFSVDTIKRFSGYFDNLLSRITSLRDDTLSCLDIVSQEEKAQILTEFNKKDMVFAGDRTLHGLFEEQVRRNPSHLAIVRYESESNHQVSLTYDQLDKKSSVLAFQLIKCGIKPGEIVGLIIERSLGMIFSILGILKAGGTYLPINPKNPDNRTLYLLDDSSTRVLISTSEYIEKTSLIKDRINNGQLVLVDCHQDNGLEKNDSFSQREELSIPRNLTGADFFAYIIYTSGSTGKPKGVPITHSNISPLLLWGKQELRMESNNKVLQNLSYYFDWSVWEIFITLTTGGCLFSVSDEILLVPDACVSFINSSGITALHVTPTQYRYLVNTGQNTKCLDYLFLGAEKLNFDLIETAFGLLSDSCRVFNMYGPTEATIISAVLEIKRNEYRLLNQVSGVPIGIPVANFTLLILDKYGYLSPVLVMGELFISGDGIAKGYLNNPELTSEKFTQPQILKDIHRGGFEALSFHSTTQPLNHSTMYRTGDLVRWLPNGYIEFLGRVDFQVKIRGLRIELGEIENQLMTHPAIKNAIVIDCNQQGETFLCAYIVWHSATKTSEPEEINTYLNTLLPHYMHPSFYISLDKIPVNPNGKVDRNALPKPSMQAGPDICLPANDVERQLRVIWKDVLKKGTSQGSEKIISVKANFFEIGGHSLSATLLKSRIHKTFNVNIPLALLFSTPTIREQAALIQATGKNGDRQYVSIHASEKKDYYPLSSAQKRLYLLNRLEPGGVGYNMPVVMKIKGEFNQGKLENVFRRMIGHNESLRTSFQIWGDVPVQRIHEEIQFQIERIELGSEAETQEIHPNSVLQATIRNFVRPFDLDRAPLLRVGIIEFSETEGIFILDMHHIISDGTSMGLLIKECVALYTGIGLTRKLLDYTDYALWQNSQKESEGIKKQGEYWLHQYADDIPVLNLPADFQRPAIQSVSGNVLRKEINSIQTAQLKRIALEENTTLFILLLTGLNILLFRLSGQNDIVIGAPIAGRKYPELQPLIGMFVNTLALRQFPMGEKRYCDFLSEVNSTTLSAYANQEYQFEDLVEKLKIKRETSRNPLFDVLLEMQNIDLPPVDLKDFRMEPYRFHSGISKFDLVIHCEEKEKNLELTVDYSNKLFIEETVNRYMDYFLEIIAQTSVNRELQLGEIELLSQEEKRDLLKDLNETVTMSVSEAGLCDLFQNQVEKYPDRVAVVGGAKGKKGGNFSGIQREFLTYGELSNKSSQLAFYLYEVGLIQNAITAILLEPSLEMVTGIIGILLAGGAYLPIDPTYPDERIHYMLTDSNAGILVTSKEIQEKFVTWKGYDTANANQISVVSIPLNSVWDKKMEKRGQARNNPSDLAYVIYTSGTTGKPKGCLLEHRNIVSLMLIGEQFFNYNNNDIWTMFHSYCFDFSVWEMYGPLLFGGKLVLVNRMIARDPVLFLDILKKQSVTVLNQTPTVFYQLIQEEIQSPLNGLHLRYVIFGGEALKPAKLKPFWERYPNTRLINMYGITETTVHVTFKDITLAEIQAEISNIGKPLPTLLGRIVNSHNQLQPLNVPGELCVGGVGVARGYLNRPELTLKKFIPGLHRQTHINRMCKSPDPIYKSGDLVKLTGSGDMEYLGRIDHQVKIRGNRVETGEIERQLLLLDSIDEALVMARVDQQGNSFLCAYIVSPNGMEPTTTELREKLSRKLPEYMIPSYFISLQNFPTTSTGKVDRRKLPQPEGLRPELEIIYKPPETEIARSVAAVWREVLKIDKVGIYDNFFDLGGNSLDLVRLGHRLKELLKKEIPMVTYFEFPTIHSFTQYLQTLPEQPSETVTIDTNKAESNPIDLDRSDKLRKGKDMMKGRRQRIR